MVAPGLMSLIQVFLQFCDPLWKMLADGTQFAVAVLRHLYKAVVIVIELSLVTVGQNLLHGLPAASKAT